MPALWWSLVCYSVLSDMNSPPQIVWLAHGSPAAEAAACSANCYLCAGLTSRGVAVGDWMGNNFTSQTLCRAPSSAWVCEACAYITSRTSPVIGRDAKEGKKFGGSFRNYSHLWDERGYVNSSKGEKPLIREFLGRDHRGPWFAAIADRGQKHVLPFAPMNGPGRSGLVLFDEVRVPLATDHSLVGDCAALLTAGEKESSARRKAEGKAAHANGRAAARAESGISRKPGGQRAEALGSASGTAAGSGSNHGEPRVVGHEDASRSEPAGPKQLGLKGFGGTGAGGHGEVGATRLARHAR